MITPSATTIGTFDGVHKGHEMILDTLISEARNKSLNPLAFSFDRHPLSLIAPEKAPKLLLSPLWRNKLISQKGIKPVILTFDQALRNLTAMDFMKFIRDEYGVRLLVIGHDNRFGSDAPHASADDYRKWGRRLNIDVVEAPRLSLPDGSPISSSAIRKAIHSGDIATARLALGYPYSISGKIVTGKQLGRTIGFPTANLLPDNPEKIIPANGVYAAIASLPDGSKLPAAVNIGHRPTVDAPDAPISIEAHICNFSKNIYDKSISLSFIDRIRPETSFPSILHLADRLKEDARIAQNAFNSLPSIYSQLPQ